MTRKQKIVRRQRKKHRAYLGWLKNLICRLDAEYMEKQTR